MNRIDVEEASRIFEERLLGGHFRLERMKNNEVVYAQGQEEVDESYIGAFSHSGAFMIVEYL